MMDDKEFREKLLEKITELEIVLFLVFLGIVFK